MQSQNSIISFLQAFGILLVVVDILFMDVQIIQFIRGYILFICPYSCLSLGTY